MRCTKCHYLSFDPEPRCRNCGHDLSMDENEQLSWAETTLRGRGPATSSAALRAPSRSTTATAVMAAPAPSTVAIATAELPLFMRSMAEPASADLAEDDEPAPMVKVPARPRVPVAVRRATPDSARLRAKYGMPPLPEPDLLDQVELREEVPLPLPMPSPMQWTREPAPDHAPSPDATEVQQSVGAMTRLAAVAIDATLLLGIAGAVLYLTLQLTGLTLADFRLLPVAPMAAMFGLLAVGYLVLFTVAGGQTLGKMAMHIRVVSTPEESSMGESLTMSQAAIRSLVALPSVMALGAGLVPALFGSGASVHDRLAHTRVVHL
ncbi:MAG: RDD family protein [Acidobacteria bacterium]|nr:RDD family protein [Acidobacteriota bacterium]